MQTIQITNEIAVEKTTAFTEKKSVTFLEKLLARFNKKFFRTSIGSRPLVRNKNKTGSVAVGNSVAYDYEKIAQNQLEYSKLLEGRIQKLHCSNKKFDAVA
ncbi:hypothetical protein KO500_04285 [Cellulophaga baltica]|uniref:hypothetical protein n=1 Tax=Cellulophaga TaxID=104264 RepID=UPI001C06DC91|nr:MULTISPECIES: hypothetical protein [Cellulophaga]MBU2995634.1 hypothetical protein [Cellulophaga baltica]MDO6767028.1 hypothetical protein [Cellulophaga sp. 1_MG-2023]